MPATLDIRALRQKIPNHCFQPSSFRSLGFVVHDVGIFLAILFTTLWFGYKVDQWTALLLRYIIYPFAASIPFTGLWVIAHECGHSAFSKHRIVNHSMGFLIHSALLTPYFSWRSTHARHHRYANNISTDLNYVPPTQQEFRELFRGRVDLKHVVEDAPVVTFGRIVLQQLVGWPWYLLTHITAGPSSSPRKSRGWWDNSHFIPSSSLFRSNESWGVAASDLGILCMCLGLYIAAGVYGSSTIFWAYVLPWMWLNHWIVMITYLHHTSPSLPKYTPQSWTHLRGALATVDRDPGVILKYMFHHIIDLHVIHHIFPRIPHYHAQEATDAIKPMLGPHYHQDKGAYWSALWVSFSTCLWVEADPSRTRNSGFDSDEDGVLWYRPGALEKK
ncbi:fatty acid desaturase-domain-containing protein [Hypoxylon sp. NC1633]|nr:fatty acid desaturase-domain-containing protein [Hypoxylon sp. NC1633]